MRHALQPTDNSPEAIVDALTDAIRLGRPDGLPQSPHLWGAPTLDATQTVLTFRALMLGAQTGRELYHHELRRRLTMPPDARPEVDVWDADGVFTPYWHEGVLEEPKYFSFFQDAPFAAYNPNHRRKWRAHEMLHGAVGFFWRPEMTRFEFYLGSRLNELLPVVHWYAWDEVFRTRCPEHRDQEPGRELCNRCEWEYAAPYWTIDDAELESRRDAAVEWIRRGQEHLADELAVVATEIESLSPVVSKRGILDASSDAIGYLAGHWNRCTAWSFGSWVEGFLADGVDYVSTIDALMRRVETTSNALLFGEIVVDDAETERLALRRHLQDAAYRCLLRIDADGSPTYQDALDPWLHVAADLTVDLLEGVGVDAAREHLDALKELTGELGDHQICARGFDPQHTECLNLLSEGLMTACPQTMDALGEEAIDVTRQFAVSDVFWNRGRLLVRFHTYLDSIAHWSEPVARYESFVANSPRVDRDFEDFGHLPHTVQDLSRGRIRLNSTFRRMAFDAAEAALLFDVDESVVVYVVYNAGEASVVFADENAESLMRAVANDDSTALLRDHDHDAIAEFLELGIIVWLPAIAVSSD